MPSFEISKKKSRTVTWHAFVSVCERLPDVLLHRSTAVVTENNHNHDASHSLDRIGVQRDPDGRLTRTPLLRSSAQTAQLSCCSSFYPFWRLLSMLGTGSFRERSGSSSSVEAQGPRSRCQVLTEEVQTLCFVQFSSLFGPKVPRVDLLRSLWSFFRLVVYSSGKAIKPDWILGRLLR